jgi:phage tail sheath protein FI
LPENAYPGVYVEEVSFRAKLIHGVETFILGAMIGVAAAIAASALRRRRRRT